jgi:hypothetical protein
VKRHQRSALVNLLNEKKRKLFFKQVFCFCLFYFSEEDFKGRQHESLFAERGVGVSEHVEMRRELHHARHVLRLETRDAVLNVLAHQIGNPLGHKLRYINVATKQLHMTLLTDNTSTRLVSV